MQRPNQPGPGSWPYGYQPHPNENAMYQGGNMQQPNWHGMPGAGFAPPMAQTPYMQPGMSYPIDQGMIPPVVPAYGVHATMGLPLNMATPFNNAQAALYMQSPMVAHPQLSPMHPHRMPGPVDMQCPMGVPPGVPYQGGGMMAPQQMTPYTECNMPQPGYSQADVFPQQQQHPQIAPRTPDRRRNRQDNKTSSYTSSEGVTKKFSKSSSSSRGSKGGSVSSWSSRNSNERVREEYDPASLRRGTDPLSSEEIAEIERLKNKRRLKDANSSKKRATSSSNRSDSRGSERNRSSSKKCNAYYVASLIRQPQHGTAPGDSGQSSRRKRPASFSPQRGRARETVRTPDKKSDSTTDTSRSTDKRGSDMDKNSSRVSDERSRSGAKSGSSRDVAKRSVQRRRGDRNRSDSSSDSHSPSRRVYDNNSDSGSSSSSSNRNDNNFITIDSMEDDLSSSDHSEVIELSDDDYSPDFSTYTRCSPADTYFVRVPEKHPKYMKGTQRLRQVLDTFRFRLVERAERVRAKQPPVQLPPSKRPVPHHHCNHSHHGDDSDCDSDASIDSQEESSQSYMLEEMNRKAKHPYRLHSELWYNDPGEMNDGPVCRCSRRSQQSGIRHGIYVGETEVPLCEPNSNNADRLYHYRLAVAPDVNFKLKMPSVIRHDGHDFTFEGFSFFSHEPIPKNLPSCRIIRFNIEYAIIYVEEEFPENFTVEGLELMNRYLMVELMELVDVNWRPQGVTGGCPLFHVMPRFARHLSHDGKELLSMNFVMLYLFNNSDIMVQKDYVGMSESAFQKVVDRVKGTIVTCPGMKPCSLRIDQLDRECCTKTNNLYPEIVHFGIRPPQLSYAGNPQYQKAWREYVKFRHLLANQDKVKFDDRQKLAKKEKELQEMRMDRKLKKDAVAVVSSEGFYTTGLMCDVVQYALLLPVLVGHLRFHRSLVHLEEKMNVKFRDRFIIQLALTHPSYRENFGTNPDHARNTLSNCGIRTPQYGNRRIHYFTTRKRGIRTLINIMSRFGRDIETDSLILHNERLEFLGDAVVEFISSIHLYFMFPDLEEGGLATYRSAIVQNQHLAVLAKKLHLDKYMLYAHGSDLCHDLELRHAMANCFEAIMGAIFLDQGLETADRVFGNTLYDESPLNEIWFELPPHPLQAQEPDGDRTWIVKSPILQKLTEFEDAVGIEFKHIRLLARAVTHSNVGFNNLTLGSNQRMEFLGDTVLQLIVSEYLYKHFPEHHEGHLSLLRSSLVSNKTESVVCQDLGLFNYTVYPQQSSTPSSEKDLADILEAFLGALYVDKGMTYCRRFCEVCFFPRLEQFIRNQDWNDPKSKLQQCCLTLRKMDGSEPDIPYYKVVECKGPTNTREYNVGVYFRNRRLATGTGHSIQRAEMAAAEKALEVSKELFPQLVHQKRVLDRSYRDHAVSSSSKDNRRKDDSD